MHAVDLDDDGRDEVVLGSIALDDDGSILWEQKLGHPDHVYVGDIDPARDGLEVVFGIETRLPKHGVAMVEGKTGKFLWGHDKPTSHIHSTGMVSDIDPTYPGSEIWSGEENSETDRWLRDVNGKVLTTPEKFPRRSLAPKSVWWDAGLQRKLIIDNTPVHYPSFEKIEGPRFTGSIRLVGDLIGDWREEVVVSQDGEIRIYSTTIPAKDRRTTLLQDRNYRASLTESTMGYPQVPLPSRDIGEE
jgi:rhamnogalacturonan endolyase